jgi:hypothetical protein
MASRRSAIERTRHAASQEGAAVPIDDLCSEGGHLKRLAASVEGDGFTAQVVEPVGGKPFIHVVNTNAARLTENITCVVTDDETWFCWSWGDTIGPVDDIDGIAKSIRYVLSPGS